MSKEEHKDKKRDLLGKAKMGVAIGSMVIGGVSDAYKGNIPKFEKMAGGHQETQDRERRGQSNPAVPKQVPAHEEKNAARRRLMDQMRDRRAREKDLEKQKNKGKGIAD